MAIYHLSASIVKRSAGRSVTAAAAYRAAAKIEDITTGLVHDYTRKNGVDYSEILSPISTSLGNEWLTDRQELWNKIEEVERRKDAQLAREITLAIPRELSRPEQIALVREYVQTNYVAAGMVADVNLHHLNGDNPHAHILLTMRNLQTTPEGVVEFGLKNTGWNSKDLLLIHRKSWEEITNKYLANYGSDLKIDCRSLKEQGSEFIPQIHVGVHAMAMHRKGKQTDRRDEFDRIQAANNDIRTQLERAYQKESTEPELEVKQELTEQQQQQIAADRKLAELIIQVMPPKSRETQTFGVYTIKPYNDGFDVRTNNNHNVILKLKLEDDTWVKSIRYPIKGQKRKHHYSHSDIDTKVDDFVKTIENHRQKIDELKIEAEAENQRAKAQDQARQAERQRAEAEARIREIDNKRAKAEAKIIEIKERRLARKQLKIEIKQREIEAHQARLTFQRLIIEKRKLAEDKNRHKNDELGKSLDILLKKWGQRVFFPEDIELTFYRYRPDQISVYTTEDSQLISTRVYSLKFIDDSWVDVLKEDKHKYSTDTLTKLVNNQHNRFDTGEIKNLELNYRELKQIPDFKAWRGLELKDHRLTEIREKSVELITTDLAKYLAEWIKERIPETDYISTENRINEIMKGSSNSIILINNNPHSSVYTYYILLDVKENKSLEIRYNRDRFEDIYGVITPAISERIKDIINDSEPIVQKQELIALEVTDSTPEVITPLSDEKIVVTIPDLPIIKLDSINSTPQIIIPLSDKKMIKQQTKRKPSRGFEQ
jgi:MobA/MobL family